MTAHLKWLLMGIFLGVVGTLLVTPLTDTDEKGVPDALADALHCPDPRPNTAAAARRSGYSEFAATHADQIVSVGGCGIGPAAMYLHFESTTPMGHVLATLDRFGAVCVADQGVFDGRALDGREHLEELCQKVNGELETFE